MKIEIRRMEPADAAQAARLAARCFPDPWTEKGFLDALSQPYTCFLAATDETQTVVGYCGCYLACGEAEIVSVAVDAAYRRKGIAHRLVSALLAQETAQGAAAFLLEVRVSNEPAIALYRSLGFRTESVRKRFYAQPVEDACVMWKRTAAAGSNSHLDST